jgi:hypothetical protein
VLEDTFFKVCLQPCHSERLLFVLSST